MIFSTFQIMHHLKGSDCNDIIHETIEFVCRSEELNFANVWLAEHHTSYCINGSPSVIAAAIAVKTQRLGIGYAVNVLPFSHPVKLAEELLLVDHLSNGRLIAGFGSGNQKRDFDIFGVDFEQKREMARESLEIIMRLWSDRPVSFKGKYYSLNDVKLSIKPFQDPRPPICVSIASKEGAAAMGKLGLHINLSGPSSGIKEMIQTYRESCPPDFKGHVGYLRNMYVRKDSVDRDRVRRAVESFGQLLTGNDSLDNKTVDAFYDIFGIYKSSSEAIEELKELEAQGVDEVLCSFRWGDLSYGEAVQSMEVCAEDILPAFS